MNAQANPQSLRRKITFFGTFIVSLSCVAAAGSHLVTTTFPVYLKYQGMVDAYYYKQLELKR